MSKLVLEPIFILKHCNSNVSEFHYFQARKNGKCKANRENQISFFSFGVSKKSFAWFILRTIIVIIIITNAVPGLMVILGMKINRNNMEISHAEGAETVSKVPPISKQRDRVIDLTHTLKKRGGGS